MSLFRIPDLSRPLGKLRQIGRSRWISVTIGERDELPAMPPLPRLDARPATQQAVRMPPVPPAPLDWRLPSQERAKRTGETVAMHLDVVVQALIDRGVAAQDARALVASHACAWAELPANDTPDGPWQPR